LARSGGIRPWAPVAGGVRLMVRVTPRGGRDAVEGLGADADGAPLLKLRIAAAPIDGEANDAVEKLLAKWLGVPISAVAVTGGITARTKTVMIDGDPVRLLHRCQALAAPKAKA
jgi:hypothetical protein